MKNKIATQQISVHEMAHETGMSVTAEQARVIANALILISSDLNLPVGDKSHRTTKDNPDYERQFLERSWLDLEEMMKLPVLKKRISQSYKVKCFDRSMLYYFTQLCIVLNV